MDSSTRTLAHAKAIVDYAAAVVASLRCREANLPKGEELAALQHVTDELEQRRSCLAEQYERLPHLQADGLAEGWRAFLTFYEDFLGRESRRRLEAMEKERYNAKKTASTPEKLHETKRAELVGRGQVGASGAQAGQERSAVTCC